MALGDNNPLWRSPRHHLDLPKEHNHVHWMELFYDLIHVVAVFLLGNYLSHHHDMAGFIGFAIIFFAFYLAWGETAIYNSLYVSTDWVYRLSTAWQTVSVMFMAASIPALHPSFSDPGKGFTYFCIAYAANRLILGLMYYRAIRSKAEETSLAKEQAVRFFALAGLFIAAALLPKPFGVYLAVFGVFITQVFYLIPKLTVMRLERFTPRMGHITERLALLLLIVNGEGFFKLVITLSNKGIYKVGPEVLINVAIGGFAVFALTWIYYDTVGNVKIKDDNRYLYSYWLGHMSLMLSAIMVGVAMAGEVYVGFSDPFPIFYGTIGCAGLAIYLASIMVIQNSVENQLAHRFINAPVMLLAIAITILCYFVFPHTPAIVGNLIWGSAIALPLVVGISRAYFTLSKEETEKSE